MRRWEHRFQRAGFAVLAVVVLAAAFGLIGEPTSVARSAGIYAFLLVVFRISGRRTLAQVTNFDLVLLLIMGDATQQALVGEDYTFTTGIVVISTLVVCDVMLGRAKHRWRAVDAVVDGLPLPLIVKGSARKANMDSEGVTMDDVLTAARETRGLTRGDQVQHAVLEQSGGISIVPAGRQGTGDRGPGTESPSK